MVVLVLLVIWLLDFLNNFFKYIFYKCFLFLLQVQDDIKMLLDVRIYQSYLSWAVTFKL